MEYTIRIRRFSARDTQTVHEIVSSDPEIERSVHLNLFPISYKLIISALQYTWISSQITIPSVFFYPAGLTQYKNPSTSQAGVRNNKLFNDSVCC